MSVKRPDPVDVEVGHRIRIERLARGLSQTALANQLGVTFQQVQKYEKGLNRISASRLHDIASALGIEVTVFFEGLPPNKANASSKRRDDETTRGGRLAEMLATREGAELIDLFSALTSKGKRRQAVAMLRVLLQETE